MTPMLDAVVRLVIRTHRSIEAPVGVQTGVDIAQKIGDGVRRARTVERDADHTLVGFDLEPDDPSRRPAALRPGTGGAEHDERDGAKPPIQCCEFCQSQSPIAEPNNLL